MNTILELLGFAAIVVGVAVVFWPAALITGGILLVLAANVRPERTEETP